MMTILFISIILLTGISCTPQQKSDPAPEKRVPADQREEESESCQLGNPCDF